jgi:LmbE family N-acetylglucosaminyl deacetylase
MPIGVTGIRIDDCRTKTMGRLTRRDAIAKSGLAMATTATALLPASASGGAERKRLTIVVAGGHPGDPEAACGGTMARLADAGHDVIALYTTRGERGIRGESNAEAAAIRMKEAERACETLKARAKFANQIDAATEITPARYEEFRTLLAAQKPDAVFTHWPIDTHRDHRGCSLLVYDAWLALGRTFALYYYEVSTGAETQHFRPTHYVDISMIEKRKRAACFAHVSQRPAEFYADHDVLHRFRGRESGCKWAEAFVHHEQSPETGLPA